MYHNHGITAVRFRVGEKFKVHPSCGSSGDLVPWTVNHAPSKLRSTVETSWGSVMPASADMAWPVVHWQSPHCKLTTGACWFQLPVHMFRPPCNIIQPSETFCQHRALNVQSTEVGHHESGTAEKTAAQSRTHLILSAAPVEVSRHLYGAACVSSQPAGCCMHTFAWRHEAPLPHLV